MTAKIEKLENDGDTIIVWARKVGVYINKLIGGDVNVFKRGHHC